MWRQDDLFNVLGAGGNPLMGTGPAADVDEVATRAAANEDPPVMVIACPLMHGTGQFSALITMIGGGAVVSLADRSFSVDQLFATIEARRATNVVIVGQAFAGPMLEFLDANPEAYDLSSINVISSSGVMWSHDNKQGLLRAPAPGDAVRLVRLVRGRRARRLGVGRRRRRADGAVRDHREQRRVHRRRTARRARARARWA